MREILFRAKCINWIGSDLESRWISGGYAEFKGKHYIVVLNECENPDTGSWDMEDYYRHYKAIYPRVIEIDPRTICQYTGSNDRKGKKIFEGDIIEDIDYGYMRCMYKDGTFIWYNEAGFGIKFMTYIPTIEVIGNIFDNPDLVENKRLTMW